MTSLPQSIACLLFISLLFACAEPPMPLEPAKPKVLLFSKTEGFRHESIETGLHALQKMSVEKGFELNATEDASVFNERELKAYKAVIFLNTTGDVLNDQQQAVFERFIQAGGGYVGIHAASDTEYGWPWYGELVGAYFKDHPMVPSNVQTGTFTVTQKDHWATQGMPDTFEHEDEFYSFRSISPNINVVLEIDDKSYQGGSNPDFHPMSWYQEFDGGRSFYLAMGHTDETYANPLFLNHLWAGLNYALGGDNPEPLNYSVARPEENRFNKVILADKLDEPMELTVLDDDRVLFIQRKGEVRLFNLSTGELKTIAKIPVSLKYVNTEGVESTAEDGLLGLNKDPDFKNNQWIYLFYSEVGAPQNVLVRYQMKGDELLLDSKKTVLAVPTQREECCHTGGSIAWDANGNLYLSTGDNTNPHASAGFSPSDERPGRGPWDAQKSSANTNDLRGKILRIKPLPDGSYSIPDGNLFPPGTAKTRPEIFSMGHRNPFRISIDQHTGYVYWGDVGPDASSSDPQRGPAGHDEIGQARKAGNFGWPHFVADNKAYVKYDFASGASAEKWDASAPVNTSPNNTGLALLPPAEGAFIWYPYGESPEFPLVGSGARNAMAGPVYYASDFKNAERAFPGYYDGKLFTYDWMRGWIMSVTLDAEGNFKRMEKFMPSYKFSNPIDMTFAANGDLYMLEYGSGWFTANDDARLIRIEYNGGNRKPQIRLAANQMGGAVPFELSLDASDTTDADFDELSFSWEISSASGFKQTLQGATTQLTLSDVGIYKVKLTVKDDKGAASTQTMEVIAGNEPPQLDLDLLGHNKTFYVPNAEINYAIEVSDKEDGALNQGIEHAQVSVSIDYLPEGYDKIEIAQGHRSADEAATMAPGKILIDGSDCMACHKEQEKSIGPAYKEVALKYKDDPTAIEYLSKKIISGGGGVWGETAMSAHPQLSAQEAGAMAEYILNMAAPAKASLPTSGTFVAEIGENDKGTGLYIIRAAYQDQGANGMPALSAEKVFTLRSSVVDAHAYDAYEKIAKMNFGGNKLAIVNESGAYMALNQIDLSSLAGIQLLAVAPTARLNAQGGMLEVHIDSPDGPLIGQSDFLKPSDDPGFTPSVVYAPIRIPENYDGSLKDIYLVFKNEQSEGQLMIVTTSEFKLLE